LTSAARVMYPSRFQPILMRQPKLDPSGRLLGAGRSGCRPVDFGDERTTILLNETLNPGDSRDEIVCEFSVRGNANEEEKPDTRLHYGISLIRSIANALILRDRQPTPTADLRQPVAI
jgi:hypothetical protein